MRKDEIRTLSDWAEPNLIVDDPQIAGNVAGQIRRAAAANDNFLPDRVWPADADDFDESRHQTTTAFNRKSGDLSLVLIGIFISYFAAAILILLVG